MGRPRFATLLVIGLIIGVAVVVPAATQEPSPAETGLDLGAFVKAAIDFTHGVHLNEARLQAILANMESLNQVGSDAKDEEIARRALHDGRVDFDVVVKDPEYIAWCAARGQEPRAFFKDLIRLQTLVMREGVNANAEEMRARMPEQRKQLEQMRSTMGEDAYDKAVAMLESGMTELDRTVALVQQVPPPSAAEASLLTKYHKQINAALGDDRSEVERY
jgi:hypothetical protein